MAAPTQPNQPNNPGGKPLNQAEARLYEQVKNSLRDMNGDGLVDYVVNSGYNEIEVFYNQTGLTNKLKKVINPLGGSFELEYERIGNKSGLFAPTISTTDSLQNMVWDMPSSKWVLQKLKIKT